MCTENVTCWGKSVQCYTCSKWVHLRCSRLSPSKFRTLRCSHSWSCPPCCVLASNTATSAVTPHSNTVTSFRTPPACIPPLSNLAPSANAALPPHPRLQTSYPPFSHSVSSPFAPSPSPLAPGFPSTPPALTPSGVFNRIRAVFKPGTLNCYIFFCPTLLTFSVFRNPILTHLPLSGSLDSLLCDLIAPTPGLAFSFMMPRTLTAVSSFSSGRAYPFLNFLHPVFVHSTPTLIM